MEINCGNHFQKVLVAEMQELMRETLPEHKMPELENGLAGWIDAYGWLTKSFPDFQNNQEELGARYLEALGFEDGQVRDIAVRAAGMAQDRICSALVRIYNSFDESGHATRAFVEDKESRHIRFGVSTGSSDRLYQYHKEQHGDVDLIYGLEIHGLDTGLLPGNRMEYLGFVCRKTGQAYALRDPADNYWFLMDYEEYKPFTEGDMKRGLRDAVRLEIVRRVTPTDSPAPGVLLPDVRKEFDHAIRTFARYGDEISFAERIEVSDYLLSPHALVRYVVDRDAVVQELADHILHREEVVKGLQREWYAVNFAQHLLHLMNGSVSGGKADDENTSGK